MAVIDELVDDNRSEDYDKILGILERLNSLPTKDVKKEMDSLELTFNEWETLTNEVVSMLLPYGGDLIEGAMKSVFIDGRVTLPYAAYNNCKNRSFILGYDSYLSFEARQDKKNLRLFNKFLENNPEDYNKLKKIAEIWDDVRIKYDPIKEIEQITKEMQTSYVEEKKAKEMFERLKKCIKYKGDIYVADDFESSLEEGSLEAMKDYIDLCKLKNNKEIDPYGIKRFKLGARVNTISYYHNEKIEEANRINNASIGQIGILEEELEDKEQKNNLLDDIDDDKSDERNESDGISPLLSISNAKKFLNTLQVLFEKQEEANRINNASIGQMGNFEELGNENQKSNILDDIDDDKKDKKPIFRWSISEIKKVTSDRRPEDINKVVNEISENIQDKDENDKKVDEQQQGEE